MRGCQNLENSAERTGSQRTIYVSQDSGGVVEGPTMSIYSQWTRSSQLTRRCYNEAPRLASGRWEPPWVVWVAGWSPRISQGIDNRARHTPTDLRLLPNIELGGCWVYGIPGTCRLATTLRSRAYEESQPSYLTRSSESNDSPGFPDKPHLVATHGLRVPAHAWVVGGGGT